MASTLKGEWYLQKIVETDGTITLFQDGSTMVWTFFDISGNTGKLSERNQVFGTFYTDEFEIDNDGKTLIIKLNDGVNPDIFFTIKTLGKDVLVIKDGTQVITYTKES